jgi:methionyl-tRNA formyltransferase
MKKYRVIFMGTPQFAVPSLQALLQETNLDVVAVVTAPDKPGGRGRKQMIQSEVKVFAIAADLTILQPSNLKSVDFVRTYHNLKPDLAVVVAFRMLPEIIWSTPVYGTINLHASLLPSYRGSAPINWAIINGEEETGLTTFMITRTIDTGGIILQEKIPISEADNAGSLHDKMMHLGASLVVKTVQTLLSGEAIFIPQDDRLATSAPKIFKEDCLINPQRKVKDIHNFIRGLSPYPGAWTKIDNLVVKIFKSSYDRCDPVPTAGSLLSDGRSELLLYGMDGFLRIEELQLEGKKRMDVRSFLNGYDITNSSDIHLRG